MLFGVLILVVLAVFVSLYWIGAKEEEVTEEVKINDLTCSETCEECSVGQCS